ncbi:MAG TPA: hypothetical protein VF819_00290 [Nitrospira sp.]
MDIQRADAGTRRRAIWIVVLGIAAGAVLLLWFEQSLPALIAWATGNPNQGAARAKLLLALIGTVIVVPLAGFAAYLWFLGERISKSGRFPLPSMKVVRDTVVVTGQAAVTRSRFVKVLAVFLAISVIGMLCMLWWFTYFMK